MNTESLKSMSSSISDEILDILKNVKQSANLDDITSKKFQEILPNIKNLVPNSKNYRKFALAGLLGLIALGLFTSSRRLNAG
ncbi:hypothetical protein [Chryseobacterium sp. MMS23-Vi53]|uniref:hypothetical protein n=1 Tax=Chryseobacterium sp. MMS23-Vi53 TaxID=3386644 RepID=UPI0039E814E5